MYFLDNKDLKLAENILRELFPESIKVYGCLYNINRGKPLNLQVIADSWPDFKVIICKPKQQGSPDREGDFNIYSIFSRDKESLKKLLGTPGVLNWNTFSLLAGIDINHEDEVKKLAVYNNVPTKTEGIMFVLTLENVSQLKDPQRNVGCTISPLSPSHAELVNNTWLYGGNQNSYNSVQSYISNYPSLCVKDESGRPISWLLLYSHCALGLLYTVPEHRRRGYAKLLVCLMVRNLLEQGYPVYCFVNEKNNISYQLFRSLGFKHKPEYRAVWLQIGKK